MNILDGNILKDQRDLLLKWGVKQQLLYVVYCAIGNLIRKQSVGKVIRLSIAGLAVWEIHAEKESDFAWQRE